MEFKKKKKKKHMFIWMYSHLGCKDEEEISDSSWKLIPGAEWRQALEANPSRSHPLHGKESVWHALWAQATMSTSSDSAFTFPVHPWVNGQHPPPWKNMEIDGVGLQPCGNNLVWLEESGAQVAWKPELEEQGANPPSSFTSSYSLQIWSSVYLPGLNT